ncbi:hypothetical protein T01_7065 [Trichinella spiralis]|uniref:Uncharacterized protein n=2 Tax=Trichinella TaxID=6333 RepID=A0A0V1BEP8_TRISP|nr:hypothetical protein T05_9121 [Trichinella murrelli]KRY35327.1 hypothetical protein T01_7065 [Trichinella spiralis]
MKQIKKTHEHVVAHEEEEAEEKKQLIKRKKNAYLSCDGNDACRHQPAAAGPASGVTSSPDAGRPREPV